MVETPSRDVFVDYSITVFVVSMYPPFNLDRRTYAKIGGVRALRGTFIFHPCLNNVSSIGMSLSREALFCKPLVKNSTLREQVFYDLAVAVVDSGEERTTLVVQKHSPSRNDLYLTTGKLRLTGHMLPVRVAHASDSGLV